MKKQRAIAAALSGCGFEFISCVPGHGAAEVFESFCKISGKKFNYSFNEEPAYTIAHGASLAGKRSAMLLKSQGFTKAGNSITDSLFAGCNASFLILIFDDRTGQHSDSIINIKAYVKGCGIPFFATEGNEPETVKEGALLSEKIKLPVVIIINSGSIEDEIKSKKISLKKSNASFKRDITLNLLAPVFSEYQNKVYLNKLKNKEWKNIPKPLMPSVPEGLPPAYQISAKNYIPFFEVFKDFRGDIVTGETGTSSLFGLPPYNCVDVVTYMGGSIPLAAGFYSAGYKNVWALSGDFSFIAAGQLGMTEILNRKIPLKIVLFNNKMAGATGKQKVGGSLLETILKSYDKYCIFVDKPDNKEKIKHALTEVKKSSQLKILVLQY